jgi:hypothetical protein
MTELLKKSIDRYFGRRDKNMVNFHGAISALARRKWEEAGHPHGRDTEFWLAAELELWQKYGNKVPKELIQKSL